MPFLFLAVERDRAVNNSKTKRIALSRAIDNRGKRIKQIDIQRRLISTHFNDDDLRNIHLWYLLREQPNNISYRLRGAINSPHLWGENIDHVFIAARDRMIFGDTHECLLRGDDVRSSKQTWAHVSMVRVERTDLALPDMPLFMVFKTEEKTEDKSMQVNQVNAVGFLRNKDPLLCHVSATGPYVVLAFGPDLLNPNCDWGTQTIYVTGDDNKKPLTYSKRIGEGDGMYESFRHVQQAVGLLHNNNKKHI